MPSRGPNTRWGPASGFAPAPKRTGLGMNKFLGMAVAIAGLLMGVSTAPVELDYISYNGAKASGYRGAALASESDAIPTSGGPQSAEAGSAGLVGVAASPSPDISQPGGDRDSSAETSSTSGSSAAKASSAADQGIGATVLSDVLKTYDLVGGYYQSANYANYFNLPPMIKSSMTYDSAEEPVHVIRFGDSRIESRLAAAKPRPGKDSAPRTHAPHMKLALQTGCGRCGQRAPQLFAMAPGAPARKPPAHHVSSEIEPQKELRLAWFSPSL